MKMVISKKRKARVKETRRQGAHPERQRTRKQLSRSKTNSEANQSWTLTQLRSSLAKRTKTTRITTVLWMTSMTKSNR